MNKKSRTTYTTYNILSGFVGQIIQTLFNFVNRMVFTRCLSIEYLGINGLFVNVLSALSLAELGIGTAIAYELYSTLASHDDEKTKVLMKFYKKAYQIIGIVVAVIGIALIPFLDFFYAEPPKVDESIYVIYLFYLGNTVVSYFYAYKRSILIADQKNYIVTVVQILSRIIQDIIQILILLVTKNFILYLSCQILMTVLYNVVVSYIAEKQYPIIKAKTKEKLPEETKKNLIVNIRALVVRKLGGVLVSSTDNILISSIMGVASAGLTSNYTLLSSTLNSILTQVFTGLTASIGNLNAVENKEKQLKMFYVVNFMDFWLYGWSAIGFAIVSSNLVQVFFGEEYVMAVEICIIMAVNLYTYGMQTSIWTYRNTLGVFKHGRYLEIITGVLNIIFSIALGMRMGVWGILCATFISRLLTSIWYDPYSIFKYGFNMGCKEYYKRYIGMGAVVVIAYIITGLCCQPFESIQNIYLLMLAKLVVCIFVPNIVFALVYRKTAEFSYLKDKAFGLLKKLKKSLPR